MFQQQDDAVRRREERFAREHQIEMARQNGIATNGSATQWQPNSLARRLGAGVYHKRPWVVSEPVPLHDPVSPLLLSWQHLFESAKRATIWPLNPSLAYSVLLTLFECPE